MTIIYEIASSSDDEEVPPVAVTARAAAPNVASLDSTTTTTTTAGRNNIPMLPTPARLQGRLKENEDNMKESKESAEDTPAKLRSKDHDGRKIEIIKAYLADEDHAKNQKCVVDGYHIHHLMNYLVTESKPTCSYFPNLHGLLYKEGGKEGVSLCRQVVVKVPDDDEMIIQAAINYLSHNPCKLNKTNAKICIRDNVRFNFLHFQERNADNIFDQICARAKEDRSQRKQ